jgi:group I intron endonuclease
MFYVIYKITNTINQKIYVGSHRTNNVDDNYMGSGKYLTRAIAKYGIENFTKDILFVFDNADDMYAKEAEIVNEQFLAEENTYNLKRGGFGGFDYINSSGLNNKANQCSKAGRVAAAQGGGFKGRTHSTKTKQQLSSLNKGRPGTFLGRHHSEETKRHLSKKKKGTGIGPNNSQFGTIWMTNHEKNVKVCDVEVEDYVKLGFVRGRKINRGLAER